MRLRRVVAILMLFAIISGFIPDRLFKGVLADDTTKTYYIKVESKFVDNVISKLSSGTDDYSVNYLSKGFWIYSTASDKTNPTLKDFIDYIRGVGETNEYFSNSGNLRRRNTRGNKILANNTGSSNSGLNDSGLHSDFGYNNAMLSTAINGLSVFKYATDEDIVLKFEFKNNKLNIYFTSLKPESRDVLFLRDIDIRNGERDGINYLKSNDVYSFAQSLLTLKLKYYKSGDNPRHSLSSDERDTNYDYDYLFAKLVFPHQHLKDTSYDYAIDGNSALFSNYSVTFYEKVSDGAIKQVFDTGSLVRDNLTELRDNLKTVLDNIKKITQNEDNAKAQVGDVLTNEDSFKTYLKRIIEGKEDSSLSGEKYPDLIINSLNSEAQDSKLSYSQAVRVLLKGVTLESLGKENVTSVTGAFPKKILKEVYNSSREAINKEDDSTAVRKLAKEKLETYIQLLNMYHQIDWKIEGSEEKMTEYEFVQRISKYLFGTDNRLSLLVGVNITDNAYLKFITELDENFLSGIYSSKTIEEDKVVFTYDNILWLSRIAFGTENKGDWDKALYGESFVYTDAELKEYKRELDSRIRDTGSAAGAIESPRLSTIVRDIPLLLRAALVEGGIEGEPNRIANSRLGYEANSIGMRSWLKKGLVVPFIQAGAGDRDVQSDLKTQQRVLIAYQRISYFFEMLNYALVNEDKIVKRFTESSDQEEVLGDLMTLKEDSKIQMLSSKGYIFTKAYQEIITKINNETSETTFNTLGLDASEKNMLRRLYGVGEALEIIGFNSLDSLEDIKTSPVYPIGKLYQEKLKKFKTFLAEFSSESTFNESSKDHPFDIFFQKGQKGFQNIYAQGIALSSTFIPLESNVYKSGTYTKWIPATDKFYNEFHYHYGFNRKVLLIDTDADAATSYFSRQSSGKRRVVTLRDLLDKNTEKVLYLDTNFYNMNEVADFLNLTVELNGKSEIDDRSRQNEAAIKEKDNGSWFKLLFFNVGAEEFTKSRGYVEYNPNISTGSWDKDTSNPILMPVDVILKELSPKNKNLNYSFRKGLALISSIYRDLDLLNKMNRILVQEEPVFMSSNKLIGINGAGSKFINSYFMYLYLNNLREMAISNINIEADYDRPLFMDVYGNILTESGYVVVPAIANSQLWKGTEYSPISTAFWYLYNEVGVAKIDSNIVKSNKEIISRYFEEVQGPKRSVEYKPAIFKVGLNDFRGYAVKRSNNNYSKAIMNMAKDRIISDSLDISQYLRVATEVMRGAPLENIDYKKEGIEVIPFKSTISIAMADTIDNFSNDYLSYSPFNSTLMSNMEFINSDYEWAIPYVFKFLLAFLVFFTILKTYRDIFIKGHAFGTLIQLGFGVAIITLVLILYFPIQNYSYFSITDMLLGEEQNNILITLSEKDFSNKELGVTKLAPYENKNKVAIQIGELDVPWNRIIIDSLMSPTHTAYTDIMEETLANNNIFDREDFDRVGKYLYTDITKVFNSSQIVYSQSSDILEQIAIKGNNSRDLISFVSPYYYILDKQIQNVNMYNIDKRIKEGAGSGRTINPYATDKGELAFRGVIEDWYTSNFFVKNVEKGEIPFDITGLRHMYKLSRRSSFSLEGSDVLQNGEERESDVSGDDFGTPLPQEIYNSQYFNEYLTDYEEIEKKIERIEKNFKTFIVNNFRSFNKVSDNTMLKVIALKLAIDHNKEFGAPNANKINIRFLDDRELIRAIITDEKSRYNLIYSSIGKVILDSSTSEFTLLLAFILVLFIFVVSKVKGFVYLLVFGAIIFSIIKNMVWRSSIEYFQVTGEHNQNRRVLEDAIMSLALVSMFNVVTALLIKLSFFNFNLTYALLFKLLIFIVLLILEIMMFKFAYVLVFGEDSLRTIVSSVVNNIGYKVSNITKNVNDKFKSFGNNKADKTVVGDGEIKDNVLGAAIRKGNQELKRSGNNLYSSMREQDDIRASNYSNRVSSNTQHIKDLDDDL